MTLSRFFLLMVAAMPVAAQAAKDPAQCALISCDCSSLSVAEWRTSCESREQRLTSTCEAKGGKRVGYCTVHGGGANQVALNLKSKPTTLLEKGEIKSLLKDVESLQWSAKDDRNTAAIGEKQAFYSESATLRKTFDKTQEKIHAMQRQAALSWRALDDADEAEDIWKDAAAAHMVLAPEQQRIAEAQWQDADTAEGKVQKDLRALAMRSLRNAANSLERAADAFERAGNPEAAAQVWQSAAELGEQLVQWKVASNAKAVFVRFYRTQAASRWYRAAYTWMAFANAEQARAAHAKAEQLLAA